MCVDIRICVQTFAKFNRFSPYFHEFVAIDMMKERFAKLLLGEDMSGGGKGVGTALAISNAITNLAGRYIFGLSDYA